MKRHYVDFTMPQESESEQFRSLRFPYLSFEHHFHQLGLLTQHMEIPSVLECNIQENVLSFLVSQGLAQRDFLSAGDARDGRYVLASPGWYQASFVVVVSPGNGCLPPVWSCAEVIKGKDATLVPYFLRFRERGWGVVVINPHHRGSEGVHGEDRYERQYREVVEVLENRHRVWRGEGGVLSVVEGEEEDVTFGEMSFVNNSWDLEILTNYNQVQIQDDQIQDIEELSHIPKIQTQNRNQMSFLQNHFPSKKNLPKIGLVAFSQGGRQVIHALSKSIFFPISTTLPECCPVVGVALIDTVTADSKEILNREVAVLDRLYSDCLIVGEDTVEEVGEFISLGHETGEQLGRVEDVVALKGRHGELPNLALGDVLSYFEDRLR